LPTATLDDVLSDFDGYADVTRYVKRHAQGLEQRRDAQLFIMAASRLGLSPTGHYPDLGLTRILDGYAGMEHRGPAIPLYSDFIQLFAASGTTITPTLVFSCNEVSPHIDWGAELPKLRRFAQKGWDGRPNSYGWSQWQACDNGAGNLYGHDDPAGQYVARFVAQQLAKLAAGGARVAVGVDEGIAGLGSHLEMAALVDGGFTPMQALRAATLNAADALGLNQDLGTVEVGKLADLIVLTKDPSVDIRNSTSLKWVIKNGRVYDADTLDEVWPRQISLAPLQSMAAWQGEELSWDDVW
jgi:hypothetical protein